jgi:hypothetical protein
MEKLQLFFKRPSVIHGLIAGALLFAVKMVFLFAGNFDYRYSPTFPMLSFLPIYAAILISGKAERAIQGEIYTYKRAFFAALRTISIAVVISILADKIALSSSPQVLNQVIEIERAQKLEIFKALPNLYDNSQKDFIMSNIHPNNWLEIIGKMIGLIFSNGLLALIIVNSTKFRKPKNEWLNNNDTENS